MTIVDSVKSLGSGSFKTVEGVLTTVSGAGEVLGFATRVGAKVARLAGKIFGGRNSSQCPKSTHLINPTTGRCVQKNGKIGKRLVLQGGIIEQQKLIMYGKAGCPFCILAREWLGTFSIPYIFVDVDMDKQAFAFIKSKGHQTVPQFYMGNTLFIKDGYTGLQRQNPSLLKQKILNYSY
jgi:glutaredoxin